MCPSYSSFRIFTMLPIALSFPIVFMTSAFVMWSVYDIFGTPRYRHERHQFLCCGLGKPPGFHLVEQHRKHITT